MHDHRVSADEAPVLRLYVTGASLRSAHAREQARRLCAAVRDCRLEVIDVDDDPGAAEDAGVIATPLLVRTVPEPVCRVVGDLSDLTLVARLLDLRYTEEQP